MFLTPQVQKQVQNRRTQMHLKRGSLQNQSKALQWRVGFKNRFKPEIKESWLGQFRKSVCV